MVAGLRGRMVRRGSGSLILQIYEILTIDNYGLGVHDIVIYNCPMRRQDLGREGHDICRQSPTITYLGYQCGSRLCCRDTPPLH